MVRAILFDCFGVIITDALKPIIEELDVTNPGLAERVMDVIHAYNLGLIDNKESSQQIADLMKISVDDWRDKIKQGEVKDSRVMSYIQELRMQGYKTALLSNIGQQSLHRRFDLKELESCFNEVVTSGEVGVMKPDAEIYLHAARILGVDPSQCIMVDDRESQCAGARAVGMQSVQYESFRQAKQAISKLLG